MRRRPPFQKSRPTPSFAFAAALASALGLFSPRVARAQSYTGAAGGALDRFSQALYGQPLADPTFESALSDFAQSTDFPVNFSLGMNNELKPNKKVRGEEIGTLKFKHFYKGREVLGSEIFLHFDVRGATPKQVSSHLAQFDVDARPGVSAAQAISLALGYAQGQRASGVPVLQILPDKNRDSARLVYVVEVEGVKDGLDGDAVRVLLDAHSGQHLASVPLQLTASAVSVRIASARDQGVQVTPAYDGDHQLTGCAILAFADGKTTQVSADACHAAVKSSCQALGPDGKPLTLNPSVCPGVKFPSADPSAQRAATNAHAMLDYFQDTHHRNSYDDAGSPVVSVIHAGGALANATWYLKGQFIAYGDGDGVVDGDFTRALDVAAHEFTHAVTDNEAHLLSIGETGALNEAYSDFFGKMVENKGSWIMGEKLALRPGAPGIRNLAAPAKLTGDYFDGAGGLRHHPYPARMADMAPIIGPCTSRNDYCDIHFNATIPGHVSWQIDQMIGHAKAQKLYYLTLTQFIAQTTDFKGAAQATLQACAKILGSDDCGQVRKAFDDAGML